MTLKELAVGQTARIDAVGGAGALRQHFLDMGVIPGVEVTVVKFAPMGDPVELRIHDYELTLRLDDAAKIEMRSGKPRRTPGQPSRRSTNERSPTPASARAANSTRRGAVRRCPRARP